MGLTGFSVHLGRGFETIEPGILVGGKNFFGRDAIAPLRELTATIEAVRGLCKGVLPAGSRTIELEWKNGEFYDRIRVERNGELVAELPGSATRYSDVDPPRGIYQYKVAGEKETAASFPASTRLLTDPPHGFFIRGDLNFDAEKDITDAVDIPVFQFVGGLEHRCEKAADVDDNGFVEVTDAIFLLTHLFLSSEPIPPPGPELPFLDPTDDAISCGK